MPDQFTESTTTGYGSRIIGSIKGIVIGFILFIASFGLLYWNEGKVDVSSIAKTATEISAQTNNFDASLNGKLVSTSGIVNSEQIIGDNMFLKPDKFIAVERKVEMYAWIEKTDTKSRSNTGGSETKDTVYTYFRDWTELPALSGKFKNPEGHENPQKTLENYTNRVTAATIGVYNFDPQSADLPNLSKLSLNAQNTILNQDVSLANDSYLFMRKSGSGTSESPQIGDLRISYNILRPSFSGSIFGKLNGDRIDPYFDQKGSRLYRVFTGTRDEGISTLHSEYTTWLWILRLIGFVMMWFGLSMLFEPVIVLTDILPIFGTISSSLIGVVTLIISLILTFITIVVSAIIHSLLVLMVVLAATIAGIIVFSVTWKKKRTGAQMTSTPPTPPPPAPPQ